MNRIHSFITSTAMAGLLLILPVGILFLVAMEIYDLLEETAAFARLELPLPPFVNALVFIALLLAGLFVLCFITGLLMMTGPGRRFASFVETSIADKVPLLGLVRNLTINLTGAGAGQLQVVEVDLHGSGTCMLGVIMETLPDGRQVVFVPAAPAVTLGQVHIVSAERVRALDATVGSLANAISQWGVGAGEVCRENSGSGT